MSLRGGLLCAMALVGALDLSAAAAVILVRPDGMAIEGKVVSQSDKDVSFQPDGADAAAAPIHFARNAVRIVNTDEHGAVVSDGSPTTQPAKYTSAVDPSAPPIVPAPKNPTYYLIPLHGEVGETVLASALEKSLADAVPRKPTVVILDIESPGGMVEEAKKIIDIIHRYNKKLRIVAFTGQDLSAAAILSLSVREIYVKPSSTIGAATSYVPGNLMLPPKIEEKMQSAWRAVARSSAEEGRHEPLLGDAMIDSGTELHLETVDGKPVVKEGDGDHTLRHKGKILTLTSREAVECGLAAGEADDLDELGTVLKLDKWTPCKGLGTLLADVLPRRTSAFKLELEKLHVRFKEVMTTAMNADPSTSVTTITRVVPTGPQPIAPPIPGRPNIPGRPILPNRVGTRTQTITVTRNRPKERWKTDSLTCVAALQQAEICVNDAIALADAYGRTSESEMLKDALEKVSAMRAKIFDDRNKYGEGTNANPMAPAAVAQTAPAAGPNLPDGMTKTDQLGGRGGRPFVKVDPAGRGVAGFQYSFGEWGGKKIIRTLNPMFERKTEPAESEIVARDGYVVGNLEVCSDNVAIIALRVTFVRMKDGNRVASDTYQSPWIGEPDTSETHTLPAKGEDVVGLFGRQGLNLDAMGLVVVESKRTAK